MKIPKPGFKLQPDYLKQTFIVAWPVIVENIMQSAVNMVDAAMVGSLGPGATAAVAVNSSPSWILNSFPMGLAVGSTVLVARNIGAGDRAKANSVASQSLGAMLIFSAVICLIMQFAAGYIPALLNADPAIRQDAAAYLRIISFAIIPHFCGLTCAGMLRGSGNTRAPMAAAVMTNIINVCLNFMLIFEPLKIDLKGLSFTLPRAGMGVRGAAVATAIAQVFSGLCMVAFIMSKRQKITASPRKLFAIKKDVLLNILKIGVPAWGERVTISLGQAFYQSIINGVSLVASAAHYIATVSESISYMTANAFSAAATTLVGQSLGAKNKEKARSYAGTVLFCAFIVGLICFIVLFFFPETLLGIFTPDKEVIAAGAKALRVMAPIEPFACLLIAITGILRGGGDTGFAFVAGLVGMWTIRLTTAYVTVNIMGMGLVGAWIGMGADITIRFVIMLARYRRKKWLA